MLRLARPARLIACALLACASISAFAQTGPAATTAPAAAPAATPAAVSRYLTSEDALSQLLALVDERLSLMPAVAAFKWQQSAPIIDPPREQAVIDRAVKLAAPLGLPAKVVRVFFELQIAGARALETHLTNEWRAQGFRYQGPIPDLAKDIRPRLDAITTEELRALYRLAPFVREKGFDKMFAREAPMRLHSDGWTAMSRDGLRTILAQLRIEPGSALVRLNAAGVIRIGTTGDYAPFSLEQEGRLSGVDIDLGRELAHTLGLEPVFIRTSWKTLLSDLKASRFDVALSGISATPARAAEAALSPAYYNGGKTMIARCADAVKLGTLEVADRQGIRFIVNPGGSNEQFAREHLHAAALRVYSDNRTIFDELIAGRADAMITDDVEVALQTHRHPELCRTTPGTFTHDEKVALIARDPALEARVAGWMRSEAALGVPQRLLETALSN